MISGDEIKATQEAISNLSQTERPFMTLLFIVMLFVIYMGIRVMRYVSNVSQNHQDQISQMNDHMREQREDHYKMVSDERIRSDKREQELFQNLEKNTEQLEGIATTIKEVQFNFISLESKVVQNFDYLEGEIESIKQNIKPQAQ